MQARIFQSTLPARGATLTLISTSRTRKNFNPRSPHGERRRVQSLNRFAELFQSTLPARGATRYHSGLHSQRAISIHAPRTGSDTKSQGEKTPTEYFNPRSPHGERPYYPARIIWHWIFQSTLPARGATRSQRLSFASEGISIHAPRTGSDRLYNITFRCYCISIHAPRTGSDAMPFRTSGKRWIFQSTLPARGATLAGAESRH